MSHDSSITLTRRKLITAGSGGLLASLAGCLSVSADLSAEEPIDETFESDDISSIAVGARNGRLSVTAEDRETVSVTGTKRATSESALEDVSVRIERSDGRLTLNTANEEDDDSWWFLSNTSARVDLEVVVPDSLEVDAVSTRNGQVTVENVRSNSTFETRNGTLEIGAIEGDIVAETRNGTIDIRDVAGSIQASARNGTINIDATTLENDIQATSRNGNIEITVPADLDADLDLETRTGSLSVDTLHESVSVTGTSIQTTVGEGGHSLEAETRTGTVNIVGLE